MMVDTVGEITEQIFRILEQNPALFCLWRQLSLERQLLACWALVDTDRLLTGHQITM
jgi:hypothetical protein